MKAGDLLFMSAQMAIDGDGLIAALDDARQPRFGSRAQIQAEHIIDNIEKLCRAAGTSPNRRSWVCLRPLCADATKRVQIEIAIL